MVVVKNKDSSVVVALKSNAAISIEMQEMRKRTALFFMVDGKALGMSIVESANVDKLEGIRHMYEDYRDKVIAAMATDNSGLETIIVEDCAAAWDAAHPIIMPTEDPITSDETVPDETEEDSRDGVITGTVNTDVSETIDQELEDLAETPAKEAAEEVLNGVPADQE